MRTFRQCLFLRKVKYEKNAPASYPGFMRGCQHFCPQWPWVPPQAPPAPSPFDEITQATDWMLKTPFSAPIFETEGSSDGFFYFFPWLKNSLRRLFDSLKVLNSWYEP